MPKIVQRFPYFRQLFCFLWWQVENLGKNIHSERKKISYFQLYVYIFHFFREITLKYESSSKTACIIFWAPSRPVLINKKANGAIRILVINDIPTFLANSVLHQPGPMETTVTPWKWAKMNYWFHEIFSQNCKSKITEFAHF